MTTKISKAVALLLFLSLYICDGLTAFWWNYFLSSKLREKIFALSFTLLIYLSFTIERGGNGLNCIDRWESWKILVKILFLSSIERNRWSRVVQWNTEIIWLFSPHPIKRIGPLTQKTTSFKTINDFLFSFFFSGTHPQFSLVLSFVLFLIERLHAGKIQSDIRSRRQTRR